MKKSYNIAVVGATGLVGTRMISILEERRFPVGRLVPVASERSQGEAIKFCGQSCKVTSLTPSIFDGIDITLFAGGGDISLEFAPIAAKKGAIVIDNSSAFRMDPEVGLVVPEVNPEDALMYKNKGIIANPNCSTIQLVVALAPLDKMARIRRVVVSTYQSVSGAGREAMEEFRREATEVLNGREVSPRIYPHQIAFNCIPHIDEFERDGYSKEEMKVINETRKIMHRDIKITATAVRVPVLISHSEAVNVEFETELSPEEVRTILSASQGIKVLDNPSENLYPLQTEAAGKDEVFVGRIRKDKSVKHGVWLWITADNLRKGAALNAVQIAELLTKYGV